MEFAEYVRKPFVVSAIEVTEENIAELAELVGELKTKEDGTVFIQVNRRLVPNVFRVFPGYWVTKMGDNVRCYTRKIFTDQFVAQTDELEAYVGLINESSSEPAEELPQPTSNVFDQGVAYPDVLAT